MKKIPATLSATKNMRQPSGAYHSQLYFSGSDEATGPRGIRTKFVPVTSGRGWPRFRIESSFRTIMKFPFDIFGLCPSTWQHERVQDTLSGRHILVGSEFVLRWTFSGEENKIEKIPMPS